MSSPPPGGEPVYHVLTPFLTDDGRALLVDRGYVPKEKLDPATRTAGNVEGETQPHRRLARAGCARRLHAGARSRPPHLVCPRSRGHRRRRSSAAGGAGA